MAVDDDQYKEIIRQCIGSVKEVFGEGRFDDVVTSIMKMQEKVLASSVGSDTVGQIAADSVGGELYDRVVEQLEERVHRRIEDDLKIMKKRILRLERAVLGSGGSPSGGDSGGGSTSTVSSGSSQPSGGAAAAEGG
ncbi:hypothetical protein [Anaplasma capra]|uniref:hypothetical protein n=1 Tax=Anaplasma capra TaxID=1562740 RepID=UPI0021D5A057|nr:hypothetical protein [Anaplasma capra]MCU7611843.1 hypothetical protein [Anaplasma capra]MCU7612563.1 hypothetical protein [Anaplasma capra]